MEICCMSLPVYPVLELHDNSLLFATEFGVQVLDLYGNSLHFATWHANVVSK